MRARMTSRLDMKWELYGCPSQQTRGVKKGKIHCVYQGTQWKENINQYPGIPVHTYGDCNIETSGHGLGGFMAYNKAKTWGVYTWRFPPDQLLGASVSNSLREWVSERVWGAARAGSPCTLHVAAIGRPVTPHTDTSEKKLATDKLVMEARQHAQGSGEGGVGWAALLPPPSEQVLSSYSPCSYSMPLKTWPTCMLPAAALTYFYRAPTSGYLTPE